MCLKIKEMQHIFAYVSKSPADHSAGLGDWISSVPWGRLYLNLGVFFSNSVHVNTNFKEEDQGKCFQMDGFFLTA